MEKRVEQQKLLFLSMCSSSDRNNITGRNSMIFTSIANYPSLFFLSN